MDAGVLLGENPALEVTEVLEHVLSEEGGEGDHARHQVHHRTQGLHGLEAVLSSLLPL